jgi:alkanesulfonate monooxygenase SsuD/methylene tetrahydromethanopterin reductase-like flavin-dependent oxidoreductase (luciferase family)
LARTAVGAWVICADTDEEAQRLAASSRMTLRLLRQGQLIAVPPPEKALAYLAEQGADGMGGRRGVIGSPQTVRAGLEALVAEYGAEEVIVVTITYDHAARRRSYELIAEAFDLRPSSSASRSAA